MKKFIFMLVTMFTFVMSANAQYAVSGHKFFDNWSVGTDGGVVTNLHDWDKPNGGVWGVQLTKAITPVFALEFSDEIGFNDNQNWNERSQHSKNGIDNVALFASAKINLSNWWFGYTGRSRVFELQARTGVGYMRTFYPESHASDNNSSLAKLGLDFDFNMGKARAWTFSVRPAVVMKGHQYDTFCDNDNRCDKYSHNCVGQLTAGLTYHFKTSNGKHHFTNVEPVEVTKIVEKQVVVEKQVIVEKVVNNVSSVDNCWKVGFAQGSSALTTDVTAIANEINKTSGTYRISGFTSPEGSERVNKALGIARANALKDALVKAGVDASRLEIDNAYESLRTATVKLK